MTQEPLVILPGMMCDVRAVAPQVFALGIDRPVMVSPLPGGERVEDITVAVMAQLPPRFALAGLGLGGIVAMEVLRRAPDRVTRLALMSTTPLSETPQAAADRDPLIIRAKAGRFREVLPEAFGPALLAAGPHRLDVLRLMHEMAETQGAEAFVQQSRAMQRRRDQQSLMRRITVPTLVLCGAEDPIYPVKRHQVTADLTPGAVLKVIDGAGYMPTLEQPGQVSGALSQWLAAPFVLR